MLSCDHCGGPSEAGRLVKPFVLKTNTEYVAMPAETLAAYDLCDNCRRRVVDYLKNDLDRFVRTWAARPDGLPAKAGVVFEPEPPEGVTP